MDTLATPKEMVPVVVPEPVKPGDGSAVPGVPEPKPEPSPPSPPAPEEPSPSEPAPQEPLPEEPKPQPKPEPQPLPPPSGGSWQQSLLAAQRRAMNARLTCEGGRCHQSVGLVTIVNKEENGWGAGQCTGSLIAPDVVATNGHCIPMDIKDAGADCRGRLWITFGDEAGLDKQLACSRIIYRHKDTNLDGADYAYFKLEKRSNRAPLRPSRAGFEHNKPYFLHKVNPVRAGPNAIGGHMEKASCLSLHETAMFDQPLTAQSHTNFFVNCLVVPGNSGSPILAADGTIRGVIYAFIKPEKVQEMLNRNGSQLPSVQEMSPLNVGSNFACLKDPANVEGKPLPAACESHLQRLRESKRQAQARLAAKLKPQASRLIEAKQGSRADIQAFGWSVRTSSSASTGRVALGYPDCVRTARASGLLGVKTSTHRPFFYIKAKYDRYVRPSNETLVWAGFADSVENISLAAEGGGYRVQITDPASSQVELNALLGACGK